MRWLLLLIFSFGACIALAHDPLASSVQVKVSAGKTEIIALAFADKLNEKNPERDLAGRIKLKIDDFEVDENAGTITKDAEQSSPAYRWTLVIPREVDRVELTGRLFPELPDSATIFAVYRDEKMTAMKTLTSASPSGTLDVGGPPFFDLQLLRHGIMHILSGLDHLLFLFGLLLLSRSLVQLLKVLTAFTVAHSISLSLIALDVIRVSPRVVEPLIALSIVVVAGMTLLKRPFSEGLCLAIVFGLIHGCGFGGGLADLGFTRSNAVGSLLTFNVGVELGQILAVMIAYPALSFLAVRSAKGYRYFSLVSSWAVVGVGLVWTVQRVFF